MKTHTIYGPPGTGKTTRLLGIVEDEVAHGTLTERIGYLAFTKRAAVEAWQRSELSGKAPWFRTIHSMCFVLTGMSRNRMFGRDDRRMFERMYGLRLGRSMGTYAAPTAEDDGLGSALLHLYDMARITQRMLGEQYDAATPDDITFDQLEAFAALYEKHKQQHSVNDFTDLLLLYINSVAEDSPALDCLIVDEAQDLSALQWMVIERLARRARVQRLYVAGDDDQAIFRWAGADVDHFLAMKGTSEVLAQSYRVPKQVHAIADSVVRRIQHRKKKEWAATAELGRVRVLMDVEDLDFSEGRWLVMARDNYLLNSITRQLKSDGILYEREYKPALPPDAMNAIHAWERIRVDKPRKGDRALVQRFQTEKMQQRCIGAAILRPWYDALDRLTEGDVEYLRAARRRGEDTRNPRLRVSTVHGAKGAEEANVALLTDISPRAQEGLDTNPDDELRVLYVGLTRARSNLYLIEPSTVSHWKL